MGAPACRLREWRKDEGGKDGGLDFDLLTDDLKEERGSSMPSEGVAQR